MAFERVHLGGSRPAPITGLSAGGGDLKQGALWPYLSRNWALPIARQRISRLKKTSPTMRTSASASRARGGRSAQTGGGGGVVEMHLADGHVARKVGWRAVHPPASRAAIARLNPVENSQPLREVKSARQALAQPETITSVMGPRAVV